MWECEGCPTTYNSRAMSFCFVLLLAKKKKTNNREQNTVLKPDFYIFINISF